MIQQRRKYVNEVDELDPLSTRDLESPLSHEEQRELARRARLGDTEARDKLIKVNRRFVISVARMYIAQGVPLADLENAGNLGLITAMDRYDERLGFRFITYAVHWVRQQILETIAKQSRVVRLPINRSLAAMRVSKQVPVLTQRNGRPPTVHELAETTGMDVHEVEMTMDAMAPVFSLDQPLDSREDQALYDTIADPRQEMPDAFLKRRAMQNVIVKMLRCLNERERQVIDWHYGLSDGEEMTLEAIGHRLDLTRERIRQIKDKAIRKIREKHVHSNGTEKLTLLFLS